MSAMTGGRRTGVVVAMAGMLSLRAGHALAASKLPQMDFANPLTLTQVGWMAVILVVLYVVLAAWGLPGIGAVITAREGRIRGDLDAATAARLDADRAIAELDRAISEARAESERTVTAAINAAKAQAEAENAASSARLAVQLARAEVQIADARATAMAALVPVAEDVAASLYERVVGRAVDRALLDRALASPGAAGVAGAPTFANAAS